MDVEKEPWTLRGHHIPLILFGVVVPDVILVVALSAMGYGLDIYSAVAPNKYNWMGNALIGACALWLCSLYVLDVHKSRACVRAAAYACGFVVFLAAAVLKSRTYPWPPMLITLFMSLVIQGHLRFTICKDVAWNEFYGTVSASYAICAALVLTSWLCWMFLDDNEWNEATQDRLVAESQNIYDHVYHKFKLNFDDHCSDEADHPRSMHPRQEADISSACEEAGTIWYMLYYSPVIAFLANAVCAGFSFFQLKKLDVEAEPDKDGKNLGKFLTRFMLCLAFLFAGMYTSLYMAGPSVRLGAAMMAFYAAAATSIVVWAYLEVDYETITDTRSYAKFHTMLVSAWRSDWVRAMAVICSNVFLIIFLALDVLKQRLYLCRGVVTSKGSRFTPPGERFVSELSTWKWCSILTKVCLLGELCFCLLVGMKLTFVFFSWLNYTVLDDYALTPVLAIVAIVGFVMFLLPPVPGSAVYIFAGIVIGKKAEDEDVGLVLGVLISSMVGLAAKLAACVGQYGIGYLLGKSVKVQQLIGVDKVPTRAIEYILKQRGLQPGKVAVLVGGPDWPVSVTCGILRVNIPQMLLGTLPVLFVSIAPQTLVGALLTKDSSASSGWLGMSYSAVASVATALAAVGQAAALLLAVYYELKVIEAKGEELAEPREEHRKVAEFTRQEHALVQSYLVTSRWGNLNCVRRSIILSAVVAILMAGLLFVLDFSFSSADKICFRPFSISDEIGDSYEDGGLKNDVLNLVLPLGWIGILLFVIAVLLHLVHAKDMSRLARKRLSSLTDEPENIVVGEK